jgi:hypothetical protein
MNSLPNENESSGQTPEAPSGKPVRLEISWQVAPAQNVAILDLSRKTGGPPELPPLGATGPVGTTFQLGSQGYKYFL